MKKWRFTVDETIFTGDNADEVIEDMWRISCKWWNVTDTVDEFRHQIGKRLLMYMGFEFAHGSNIELFDDLVKHKLIEPIAPEK